MHDDYRNDYVKYRVEKAQACLRSALREFDAGEFFASTNRSYYCIFHAMRAVLVLDSFDTKKHSGIISAFRQRYIKTAVFPVEFSRIIEDAFDARNHSDYEDFFIISKNEVAEQIENAKIFLAAVEAYLSAHVSE